MSVFLVVFGEFGGVLLFCKGFVEEIVLFVAEVGGEESVFAADEM